MAGHKAEAYRANSYMFGTCKCRKVPTVDNKNARQV